MTGRATANERRLWMGMARLVGYLSREAGQAVQKAEHLTLSEMTLMGQLRTIGGSARMVDLAARLQLTKAAITKIVHSLEARGCLDRRADPSDGRVVLAVLTDAGREVLTSAERAFEEVMRRDLWERLTNEEMARLVAVLDRVQDELDLPRGALMPPDA